MYGARTATALALALALAGGVAATGGAIAAEQESGGAAPGTAIQGQTPPARGPSETAGSTLGRSQHSIEDLRARADQLIGRNVVNQQGENVGELQDIVLDKQKNEPQAVLQVGGMLGIGGKEVVIPFNELQLGQENITLISQRSEDQLKQLPEYKDDDFNPLRQKPTGMQQQPATQPR